MSLTVTALKFSMINIIQKRFHGKGYALILTSLINQCLFATLPVAILATKVYIPYPLIMKQINHGLDSFKYGGDVFFHSCQSPL